MTFKRISWALLLLAGALGATLFFSHTRTEAVKKSPRDPREYKTFTLKNGLTVFLVSDPKANQGAASLSVRVGQLQDPKDRQGLAHYLEHMLFLGTQKYPDSDEFMTFLSQNGGNSNAFTALEDTNYHFAVNRDQLEGALDRFAQFFIAPKFDPQFALREIHAVDSEHQKNLKNDFRRAYEVQKGLYNPAHPITQFGTGNLRSLGGEELDAQRLQEDLIAFYQKNYRPNRMKLAVLGPQSLEQLEAWVRVLFGPIPNQDLPDPKQANLPPITAPLPRLVRIDPVSEQRNLKLSWVVPPQKEFWREKPALVLGQLLGDEGKGSLLSYLKAQGWASKLNSSAGFGTRDFGLFELYLELTPKGLEHWPQLVEAVFAYLGKVRAAKDLERYQEEMNRLGQLEFKFLDQDEPIEYVQRIASGLQDVPAPEVLAQPYLYAPLKPGQVEAVLGELTPDKVSLYLTAKGQSLDRTEPWYQTPYSVAPVPPEVLARWQDPAPLAELSLPPANPFIPSQVELVPRDQTSDEPNLLEDGPGFRLWFKQDDQFESPKVQLMALLASPLAYDTPKDAALARLYAGMIRERLNEFAYPASQVGLEYRLENGVRGLELRLSGYPETIERLLAQLLTDMKAQEIDPVRFETLKRDLKEDRVNQRYTQAFHRSLYELYYLISDPLWHNETYLEVIDPLTPADLRDYSAQLLSSLYLEVLTTGNLNREGAQKLAQELKKGLGAAALTPADLPQERSAILQPGRPLVYPLAVEDVNSAVHLLFQTGPVSPDSTAKLTLLAQLLEKPAYHQLRTIEQLGYVVWTMRHRLCGAEGLAFVIQSNQKRPPYLEDRIEHFLVQFERELAAMPEEEYQAYQAAVVQDLVKPPKNLQEETEKDWAKIKDESYDFGETQKLALLVPKITREELLSFYRGLVLSPQRKLLAVQAFGKGIKLEGSKLPLIKDPKSHKLNQSYYPKPKVTLAPNGPTSP